MPGCTCICLVALHQQDLYLHCLCSSMKCNPFIEQISLATLHAFHLNRHPEGTCQHLCPACRWHTGDPRSHSNGRPEGPAAILLCAAPDPGSAAAGCSGWGSCRCACQHGQWEHGCPCRGSCSSAGKEGASTLAACPPCQERHPGKQSSSLS